MVKAYRIMGVAFSFRRDWMEEFSRQVEDAYAGTSPHLERHARNILLLGEMVNVPSDYDNIASKLPQKTRMIFQGIYPRVRPPFFKRAAAHVLGPLLVPRAVGKPP